METICVDNIDEKTSLFYLNDPNLLIESLRMGFEKFASVNYKIQMCKQIYSNQDYHFLFDALIKMQAIVIKYHVLFRHIFRQFKEFTLPSDSLIISSSAAMMNALPLLPTKEIILPEAAEFCIPALNYCLKAILKCFITADQSLSLLVSKYEQLHMVKLISEISRLSIMDMIALSSVNTNIKDIFYQPPNSDDWKLLKSILVVEVY